MQKAERRRAPPLEKQLEDHLGDGWLSSLVIRWVVDSDERSGLTGCFSGLISASPRSQGRAWKDATSPAPSTEDSTAPPLGDQDDPSATASQGTAEDVEGFDVEIEDSMGVPWFKEDLFETKNSFIADFFVDKDESPDGSSYIPGAVSYKDSAKSSYPPRTYNRRVSTNIWQTTLAGAMLEAGLRLVSLQAMFKLNVMLFWDESYAEVPISLKMASAGLFCVGILAWVCLAFLTAWSYRDFTHPDNQIGKLLGFGAAALLSMFAMPNDVALLAIHMLPASHGGLLQDQNCIAGNQRWPVHTIAHHCKADHDYTNWSGSKVQLPLFVFIDVGGSMVIAYISWVSGVINFAVLLMMSSTFVYASYRVYVWLMRWHLRRPLLKTWLQMSTDLRIAAPRRQNVMAKYIAEGGDRQILEREMKQLDEQKLDVPNTRKDNALIAIGMKHGQRSIGHRTKAVHRVASQVLGVPLAEDQVQGDNE